MMLQRRFSLQALSEVDAPRYNEFLRQGVRAHPDTLRISEMDIAAVPFRLEHGGEGDTFAAVGDDGSWLGVVTIEREQGRSKRRHIAWLLRMYVPALSAGAGVGRALLRHAVARARRIADVEKVNLTVAAHNQRAIGLYESEGFRVFAREDDAFRDDERRSELTLSLRL